MKKIMFYTIRIICFFTLIHTKTYAQKSSKISFETTDIIVVSEVLSSTKLLLPDLKPATSELAAIKIDGSCNMKILIENWGQVASAPSTASIRWLNTNGVPSSLPIAVPSVPKAINQYQPGIAYSENINSQFHSITSNVTFTIVTDSTDQVTESNEENNKKNFAWNVNISGGIPPQCVARPDLIVKSV